MGDAVVTWRLNGCDSVGCLHCTAMPYGSRQRRVCTNAVSLPCFACVLPCQANDNRELILWWGKYLESLGEYGKALDCYRKAGDSLSMTRIFCFQRDWKAAEDEVRGNMWARTRGAERLAARAG